MGSSSYEYFVPYQPDINAALQALRQREFQAGRYNPVIPFPRFPVFANSAAPGPQHDTIEEALADTDADGTRSILDLFKISDEPDFFSACPLPDELLLDLYGTTQPTREMLDANMQFLEDIERGHGIYLVLYKDGQPDEIFFCGYSFD